MSDVTQNLCKVATFEASKRTVQMFSCNVVNCSALVGGRSYYRPKACKPNVLAGGQKEGDTGWEEGFSWQKWI